MPTVQRIDPAVFPLGARVVSTDEPDHDDGTVVTWRNHNQYYRGSSTPDDFHIVQWRNGWWSPWQDTCDLAAWTPPPPPYVPTDAQKAAARGKTVEVGLRAMLSRWTLLKRRPLAREVQPLLREFRGINPAVILRTDATSTELRQSAKATGKRGDGVLAAVLETLALMTREQRMRLA